MLHHTSFLSCSGSGSGGCSGFPFLGVLCGVWSTTDTYGA